MLIHNQPIRAYLSNKDYVSRSTLFDIYSEPSLKHVFEAKEKESNALDMGDAVHVATLEPDIFNSRFLKGPEDRRGNRWLKYKDKAQADSKTLLIEKDFLTALEIAKSVRQNKDALRLLNGPSALKEISCYSEIDGVKVKARADILNSYNREITDLKTTTSVGENQFISSIITYGYHVQAGFYHDVFASDPDISTDFLWFHFIAVEKKFPYISRVITLNPEAVEAGKQIYKHSLRIYKEYLKTKQCNFPEPCFVNLPKWAYKEMWKNLVKKEKVGKTCQNSEPNQTPF